MRKTLTRLLLGGALAMLPVKAAHAADFVYSPVNSDMTLVPDTQQEWLVQANSSDESRGTVSGPTNDWLSHGLSTNVVASANTNNHSRFIGWYNEGSLVSTDSNYNFSVVSPTNLVANFDVERFNVSIADAANFGANPTNFTGVPYGGSVTSTFGNAYYTNAAGSRLKVVGLKAQ